VRHTDEPVAVMPWQKADLEPLGLDAERAARAAWWIEPSGRRLRGHRAIGAALAACGGGWRLAGRALLLPPPFAWLAAAGYGITARLRGLLPGITPACRRRYDWDAAGSRPCRR
jgi:predicted DCC family thiol-disulfide oxidoreductase YuxK